MTVKPASLGNITKFAATEAQERVIERFWYQALARELLPEYRIKICFRHRLSDAEYVKIYHSAKAHRAHYKNLMKCKSVWVCAVCASKITEVRRLELTKALANASDRFVPLLLTYTIKHGNHQPLKFLLTEMLAAFRDSRSGRPWRTIRDEYMLVGSVRATEVTYGANGWHPHFHEIMLFDKEILTFEPDVNRIADSLNAQITDRWIACLERHNLTADRLHGLDVRSTYGDVAEYVAKYGHLPRSPRSKWSIEHELTKSGIKRGTADHRTPFELLRDYGLGDKQSGKLFQEYAEAFFGKSQLVWSRGTKALLQIDEISDDQALDETTDDERLLAALDTQQWRVVLANNAVGRILAAAHTGELSILYDTLDELTGMAGTSAHYLPVIGGNEKWCLLCNVQMRGERNQTTGETVYTCPNCGQEVTG